MRGAGRGRCGGTGEGGDCDITEAGWSKAIRDLIFSPPLAAAAAAWKRLEKWNKQGEGRENEEVHC